MLYSANLSSHLKPKPQGMDSYLRGDRIFNGMYWDEFSLTQTALCSPKILILGAGHGACIRPLLARYPEAKLTLVDNDPEALNALREVHDRYFEITDLDCIACDAQDFSLSRQGWDIIWLDLYSSTGMVPMMWDDLQLARIADALAPKGTLYFNLFSTPCYLGSTTEDSRVRLIAKKMSRHFPEIRIFPHRRNFTFSARRTKSEVCPPLKNSKLSPTDALLLRCQTLRHELGHLEFPCAGECRAEETTLHERFSFDSIQRDLKLRVPEFKAQIELDPVRIPVLSLLARDAAELAAAAVNSQPAPIGQVREILERSRCLSRQNIATWILPSLTSWLCALEQPSDEAIFLISDALTEVRA